MSTGPISGEDPASSRSGEDPAVSRSTFPQDQYAAHQPAAVRTAPPQPPLSAARALLITFSVFLLSGLLTGPIAALAFSVTDLWPTRAGFWILLGVLAVVASLIQFGLWLANVVLAVLVVVKGRDSLRTGAAIALGAVLAGGFFSLDVSGDLGSADPVSQVVGVLMMFAAAFQVVVLACGAVAVVLLLRGIAQATRR